MARRANTSVVFEQGQYRTLLEPGRYTDEPYPGTQEWRIWLDVNAIPSFGFSSETGTHYTVRRERRARGGDYWYAYRKQEKRLRKVYVGRTFELDLTRLIYVAQLLVDQESAVNNNMVVKRERAAVAIFVNSSSTQTLSADPAISYLQLLGSTLDYTELIRDGSGTTVYVGEGVSCWEDFLKVADPIKIAQATSQAVHLCRMLNIPIPGEKHHVWCTTERAIYNGRHDHLRPGQYQDCRGNWWCEECNGHGCLINLGEKLNYCSIALDTTLTIRQGYQGWFAFARTAGHGPIFCACRIAIELQGSMLIQTTECKHQPCQHAVVYQDYLGNGWCEYHATGYAFICVGTALDFPTLIEGIDAGRDAWVEYASHGPKDRLVPLLKQARNLLFKEEQETV